MNNIKKMRQQRKLLTPALETGASQPGTGTALMIDIMQTVHEPLLVLDSDLRVISANRSFYNFFKVIPEETAGKHIYDLGNRQWDILKLRTLLEILFKKNNSFDDYKVEHEFLSIGHKVMLLSARCINQNPPPKAKVVLLAIKDITGRNQAEEELRASEKKYRALFERSIDGIYESTIEGKYIDASPALVKLLGYENKEELMSIDIPTQLYVSKNDRPEHKKRDRVFETKLKKKDGSVIYVGISSRVVYKNNKPAFYEGIVRDITEQKKIEEKLKFLSFHDNLTGLYNRAYFEEELKRLGTGRQLPLSVIIGDINGLKLINDAFGHTEGDKLLVEVAKILNRCSRKEDIVARTGGDEFCILLPQTSSEVTQTILNRINKACKEYKRKTDKETYYTSISLGYATKSIESEPFESILKVAEEFMYKRKLLERKSIHSSIISSIKTTVFEKSHETEEHAERMIKLSKVLGKALSLTDEQLTELELLSTLHDIGKISIDDHILSKSGKLTDKEWSEMKKHSEVGYRIAQAAPEIKHIADYILCHHEHWDGSGYPQGLIGEAIPLLSRITAVLDAYDTMIHDRPYRKAMPKEAALAEIMKNAGTQFDPNIARIFAEALLEKHQEV